LEELGWRRSGRKSGGLSSLFTEICGFCVCVFGFDLTLWVYVVEYQVWRAWPSSAYLPCVSGFTPSFTRSLFFESQWSYALPHRELSFRLPIIFPPLLARSPGTGLETPPWCEWHIRKPVLVGVSLSYLNAILDSVAGICFPPHPAPAIRYFSWQVIVLAILSCLRGIFERFTFFRPCKLESPGPIMGGDTVL